MVILPKRALFREQGNWQHCLNTLFDYKYKTVLHPFCLRAFPFCVAEQSTGFCMSCSNRELHYPTLGSLLGSLLRAGAPDTFKMKLSFTKVYLKTSSMCKSISAYMTASCKMFK